MTLKTLAAATCLSVAMTTSTIAAPVTVDFEFNGSTGTFYGLDDADGTSSATSFDLNLRYGPDARDFSSWTNLEPGLTGFDRNRFEFRDGKLDIVDFRFRPGAIFPVPDDDLRFDLVNFELYRFYVGRDGDYVFDVCYDPGICIPYSMGRGGNVGLVVRRDPAVPPVAPVPLPAGGLLLLSAFGGVAALKRRKKRAA